MNHMTLPVIVLCLAGCGPGPAEMPCIPETPEFPPHWKEILGVPRWRLEWINPGGSRQIREIADGERMEITVIPEWPSPVLAWPLVPGRGIRAGVLKPAGGIFPWDAAGKALRLGWQGGLDAFFYRELATAFVRTHGAGRAGSANRLPQYFDWPRFRELFTSGVLSDEAVRGDPWLADWTAIAEKTVQSGFDRRRIKASTRTGLSVPVDPGPWAGTSPFALPLFSDEGPIVFPVGPDPDTWYSAGGAIRCSEDGWILLAE
ncbi:MAG: hypothetical protein LBG42_07735 [Treponema sp.]|nr:hypothetical protein [Treponema sp.]